MAIPNTGPKMAPNSAGIFEIRWSEAGRSKRVSTRTKDLSAAQKFFAEFLSGKKEKPSAELSVADCLDRYMSEHVDQHVTDPCRQEDAVLCLKKGLGHMTVKDLDAGLVNGYCRQRREGHINRFKVGNGTLRRELNVLVAAINHAVKNRRLTGSDAPFIPLPLPPAPKDLWLTEEERDKLLNYADAAASPALRLFIEFALGTAARRDAIENLDWKQIDLAAKRVNFLPAGDRQTNKRRVPVPLSKRLVALLERVPVADRVGPVLGTTRDQYHPFMTLCADLADATGNDKFREITPHTLRHTWATLAARRGVELYKIAGVLGDTLPTVTRVYLHHSPEHLRDAVD